MEADLLTPAREAPLLRPGRIAGIFGPGAGGAALRALVRPLLAGGAATVVDGGNLFDPYEMSREERRLGGDGKTALSRVRVSRAFTCHQMEALLARTCHGDAGPPGTVRAAFTGTPGAPLRRPRPADRAGAGNGTSAILLVLGFTGTFADADVPYAESCRLFHRCLAALRRAAGSGGRVLLAGGGHGARPGLFRRLAALVEPLIVMEEGGETLHPTPTGRTRRAPAR
jgi:hypothetical protein